MSEDNEQYAYFTITDSFDPAEITRRIGVEPTKAWRKGDLHPKNQMERKFSRWSLASRLDRAADWRITSGTFSRRWTKSRRSFRA
jgi:hypothetical protein